MGERLAKTLQDHVFPPVWTFLLGKRKIFFLFGWGESLYGCFTLGGPGILGLGSGFFHPWSTVHQVCQCGCWLTHGDLALASCAQFLAVAEALVNPFLARSSAS